jgi:hypothetical protein
LRDKNKEILARVHLDQVFQELYQGKVAFMIRIMEINRVYILEI